MNLNLLNVFKIKKKKIIFVVVPFIIKSLVLFLSLALWLNFFFFCLFVRSSPLSALTDTYLTSCHVDRILIQLVIDSRALHIWSATSQAEQKNRQISY